MNAIHHSTNANWPDLPYQELQETITTLHLWTQIVGKIRLVQTPWINHSWHVPLYISTRGLSTSPIPYNGTVFEIEFDFLDRRLVIQTTDGRQQTIPLEPDSVADFYQAVFEALGAIGLNIRIHTTPSEIANAIPFEQDTVSRQYNNEYAARCWQALVQIDRVFKAFRSRFIGKCSPVHFFWGSFDLAVTRFSGREAPPHPGGIPNFPDWVAREAYSHEVSSAGFWFGGGGINYPAFYSYAYPAPEGFAEAKVQPRTAFWSKELGEFILPYEEVCNASSPDEVLLAFLQSTYEAAAECGNWDRAVLERELVSTRQEN